MELWTQFRNVACGTLFALFIRMCASLIHCSFLQCHDIWGSKVIFCPSKSNVVNSLITIIYKWKNFPHFSESLKTRDFNSVSRGATHITQNDNEIWPSKTLNCNSTNWSINVLTIKYSITYLSSSLFHFNISGRNVFPPMRYFHLLWFIWTFSPFQGDKCQRTERIFLRIFPQIHRDECQRTERISLSRIDGVKRWHSKRNSLSRGNQVYLSSCHLQKT